MGIGERESGQLIERLNGLVDRFEKAVEKVETLEDRVDKVEKKITFWSGLAAGLTLLGLGNLIAIGKAWFSK